MFAIALIILKDAVMPGAECSQITMCSKGFDCFQHFFRTTRTVLNPSNVVLYVPLREELFLLSQTHSVTSKSLKVLHIATYILHFY